MISAHSIQKSGQLALIAENGHVYRLSADITTLKQSKGTPQPKKIGVNQASTFLGFCKKHDNGLFEIIDNHPLLPDKRQIALYAYRSICREFFVKENAVAVLDRMIPHGELTEEQRSTLNAAKTGHSLALSGLQYHKRIYDRALQCEEYDTFEFTYFTSTSQCSLQLSGLLYPDYDFFGNPLQDLGAWSSPLDLITFFTAPIPEGWAYGFAWHTSSNATCIAFMQSLAALAAGGGNIEDALLRFSLSCCENHAIRISWWDSLSVVQQTAAVERMHMMAHPSVPVPIQYLAVGCEEIAAWNFEYVHTTLPSTAA